MPTAEIHKPPTRQIEYGHGQNPHGVNERQTVTIADQTGNQALLPSPSAGCYLDYHSAEPFSPI